MAKNKNVHESLHGRASVRSGSGRASSVHDTQADAIDRGRDIAARTGTKNVIHMNGRTRDSNRHESDPFPPRTSKPATAAVESRHVHVVPSVDGGWSVKKEGADRASKRFPTQDAAESWGRMQSIKEQSALVIHRRDGTIAQKNSYGNDPHPPRDRKK